MQIAQAIEVMVLIIMIVSAFFAIKSKDLLVSVIYLSVLSLMLAVEFYILQAPDVAITEAVVGAALSTAIFVIAIYKTNRIED